MEYKLGDPERGKTIFEGIVDSHPKRWDLWSIYIDMEAGQSDIQSIRWALCIPAVLDHAQVPVGAEIFLTAYW